MPEVRRQGSIRGGAGGAARIDANSSSAHFHFFAALRSSKIFSRSSISNSTSKAA